MWQGHTAWVAISRDCQSCCRFVDAGSDWSHAAQAELVPGGSQKDGTARRVGHGTCIYKKRTPIWMSFLIKVAITNLP